MQKVIIDIIKTLQIFSFHSKDQQNSLIHMNSDLQSEFIHSNSTPTYTFRLDHIASYQFCYLIFTNYINF